MRRPTDYRPTPETADVPLTLDDVEGLRMVSGAPLRQQRTLLHFLGRVEVSFRYHISQLQGMAAEIDRLNARASTRFGQSTTLSPLDAVKFLSDEQRTALFQGMQRDAYAATVAARAAAEDAAARTRRTAAALRFEFLRVAEDPSVPPEIRERLVYALAAADRAVAEGTEPDPAPAPTTAPATPTAPAAPAAPAAPSVPEGSSVGSEGAVVPAAPKVIETLDDLFEEE